MEDVPQRLKKINEGVLCRIYMLYVYVILRRVNHLRLLWCSTGFLQKSRRSQDTPPWSIPGTTLSLTLTKYHLYIWSELLVSWTERQIPAGISMPFTSILFFCIILVAVWNCSISSNILDTFLKTKCIVIHTAHLMYQQILVTHLSKKKLLLLNQIVVFFSIRRPRKLLQYNSEQMALTHVGSNAVFQADHQRAVMLNLV